MAKALRERLQRPLSIFILLLGMLLPLGWKALGTGGRPMADPSSLPIVPGALWRCFKGVASAPPAGWTGAGFDDSTWPESESGFGYGDGDDATVLHDMQGAYTSVYIRKEFLLADLTGLAGLTLTLDYDDAYVVYVNGTEIARSASLGGTAGVPPAYDTTAAASHEASGGDDASSQPPDLVTIPVAALVAGTNAIAIAGFNQAIDSSDFSLIPTVEILNDPPGSPAGATPPDGQTGVSTSPQLCVTVTDPEGGPLDVTFHGREAGGNAGEDFTVIALPDTQYYSASHPATFQAQTAWIRDQRAARRIAMVTGLGDCVDDAEVQAQWDNASAAYALLEDPLATGLPDGVPYGVAVGNHDQVPNGFSRIIDDENVPTVNYNQTFPKSRFSGRGYFGGNYPLPGLADSMDNHYELWSASGMDFITFHLEWDDGGCSWPASGAEPAGNLTTCQDVLRWVRQLLSGPHASRRAIITTHFMGTPSPDGTGTLVFSPQGQAILNAVRPLPNVFLLLGGHLDQADHRTDLAVDGHAITTLVSDYQTRPNGGNGWLRILTFQPQAGAIHVETYSPLLGRSINKLADGTPDSHPDNLAPTENEITVPYAMDAGNPFSVVGTETGVPSGLTACVTWPGLDAATTYDWFASVTDGVSSTIGPRLSFTTTNSCTGCDDGDACTTDTCDPVTGCAHVSACDDGNPCTADSCDPQTGCLHEPLADGTGCSDGSVCTAADVCSGGACAPGPPLSCDDANPCTDDTCHPVTGCAGTPILCDDGDPCTSDACIDGACVSAPAAGICGDGVACTDDACAAGPANGGLQLDGSAAAPQHVAMGPGTPRLGLSRFTLEAWIRWDGGGATVNTGTGGFNPDGNGGAIPIVARGRGEADGGTVDSNYFLGLKDGRLVADFEEGTGGTGSPGLNHPVCGSTLLGTASWHHVAATYDGSCWQLYVDGQPETLSTACSSCTQTGACDLCPGRPPRSDSVQHFGIGSALNSTGVPEGAFQGRIDEVRVWDYARTAAEIAATRDKRVQQSFGLAGRWGLDEGTGAVAADGSGGGLDGALIHDPAWTGGAPALGAALCSNTFTPGACCTQTSHCDDANACTEDACDTATHACGHTPIAGSCDDGSSCTTGDACTAGVCTGSAVPNCCETSAQCDDADACTADVCRLPNVAALQFDGINDWVTMGPAPGLGLAQFTLEGWIKWSGGGNPASTGSGGLNAIPIITKGRSEADDGNIDANYFLGIVNGRLAADFEQKEATLSPPAPAGQNRPICGSIPLPVGAWAHVAVTYDGTWRLYVDGVEGTDADGTACTSPACDPQICARSPGAIPRSDSIQHFGIGSAINSTGAAFGDFAGQMDEIRVWNRALSQAEIAGSMHEQLTAGTGLVARWGFDENGGSLAADSIGPSFDNGSLAPNPTIGPTWVTAGLVDFGHETCAHLPANLPPEINGSLRLTPSVSGTTLTWDDAPGDYNVYRGSRSGFSWSYNQTCLESHLALQEATDDESPARGSAFFYVVTRLGACGESVPARDSGGSPYPNQSPCP